MNAFKDVSMPSLSLLLSSSLLDSLMNVVKQREGYAFCVLPICLT